MDLLILVSLLGLALLPRLSLLILKGFEIFHSDHAVFGLMAKHILEGKPMIYYYGQGYMGPLDSFVAAMLFPFLGMNLFSIQLAPVVSYLLFLIANFYLLRKVFGLEVSLMANLLLALSPPALTVMCATLGGYPEMLFLGSLMLLSLIRFSESGRQRWAFLAAFLGGTAFWTNNLILLYFFALGILLFLKSEFWKKAYPSCTPRRILLLEKMEIPVLFRIAGIVVHAIVMGYLLWNMISFFTNETLSIGGITLKMASPAFHVKKVKKIFLLLGVEIAVLTLARLGFNLKKFLKGLRPFLPSAAGFLLGASPAIFYTLFGGEGYRVIHGSGMILARDFPKQFRFVVWEGFFSLLGVPIEFLRKNAAVPGMVWAGAILVLLAFLFLYFCFLYRQDLRALIRLKPHPYSYPIFALLLIGIFIGVCLFNNLQAARYLYPSYFGVSLVLAIALARLRLRIGIFSWLLLVMLLASQGYANVRYLRRLPDLEKLELGHESILKFLKEHQIQGAYAHFVTSYVLTFQSQEKIIVAPYRSPDRYPNYTEYVDRLDRVAYIFQEDDSFSETFQRILDQNKISYGKVWFDPFWVFTVDRTRGSEKGLV